MIIKNHFSGLLLFTLFISCSSYATENNFDSVCRYFQELDKNTHVENMTNLQRNDFIIDRINKNLPPSSNARAAWEAIGYAVAEQRYVLFQSAAESVLNMPWQCPTMQKWAAKTGEF